jgi:hypothetical protein
MTHHKKYTVTLPIRMIDLMNMLLLGISSALVATIVGCLTGFLNAINFRDWIINRNKNRVTLNTTISNHISHMTPRFESNQMSAVLYYINLTNQTKGWVEMTRVSKNTQVMKPTSKITIEGIDIIYSHQDVRLTTDIVQCISIVLTSEKPLSYIKDFLDRCYDRYTKDVTTCLKETQAYYIGTRTNNDHFTCVRYPWTCFVGDEELYISEMQLIEKLVNDYITGVIPRITFLLHGCPGTGKTSLIKKIAKMTGSSIIDVNLKDIHRDDELFGLLHSELILGTADEIPPEKRLYVLEEIDTMCSQVLKDKEVPPDVTVVKKEDKITVVASQLTKGGIRKALDGVCETRGILIMTTNKKDSLDPAMIRPMRITLELELKPLLKKYADDMILKKFGDVGIEFFIKDYEFTPAELKAMLIQSKDVHHFHDLVKEKRKKT